jgi:hypothetical protein
MNWVYWPRGLAALGACHYGWQSGSRGARLRGILPTRDLS